MSSPLNSLLPVLDFEVLPIYNPKKLFIQDTSDWKHLESETSYIDITVPGSRKAITQYFTKHFNHEYNSNSLDYTYQLADVDLVDIADGVYKIKIYICDGCEFAKEKYWLKSDQLQRDIDDKVYGMVCNMCDSDKKKWLQEVKYFLDLAHLCIRKCDIDGAMKFYEMAKEELKRG